MVLAVNISLPLLALIVVVAVLIFFFLLGKLTWGTGADLVDWDPVGRSEQKRVLDDDDLNELLELRNRRRREQGLPELGVNDVLDASGKPRPD